MKRSYTASPGTNLVSISLDNALGIKGIVIDNPSGGWLYIVELKDYVKPYTLSWARTLEYTGTSLNVIYGLSPAGQINTIQGDPYTVTLYDEPVSNSAGIDDPKGFIEQFTPVTSATSTLHLSTNGPNNLTVLIAGIAGKRIRVWSIGYVRVATNPSPGNEAPLQVTIFDSAQTFAGDTGSIAPQDTSIFHGFPAGLDFPVGNGVSVLGQNPWASGDMIISITYSVI